MIRIMIVDDEPHILRRLTRYIERNEPDFSIVATASDGQQALSLLEHAEVDALFTDIRMPIMDGLTLLKIVEEQYPQIIKVVISGYDEFEYVAGALRSNSLDYLLKPVAENQLRELFGRLRKQFQAQYHARTQDALRTLIDGVSEDANTAVLPNQCFVAAVYCAGNWPLGTSFELSDSAGFWSGSVMEGALRHVSVGSVAEHWVFTGSHPAERILLVQEGSVLPAAAVFEHLQNRGMTIHCAFDPKSVAAAELPKHLSVLRKLLRERIRIGVSSFLSVDKLPNENPSKVSTQEALIDLACAAMRTGGELRMNELFDRFRSEQQTELQIATVLTLALAQNRSGTSRSVDELIRLRGALLDAISDSESLEALRRSMLELFTVEERPQKEDHQNMRAVAEYLDRHYAESITTQTLSSTFGYVPSYLSLLFRREYGCSPADYLQNIRIERAKDILKHEKGVFVKEVAFRVGFKNQFHFSKTFKTIVGVQPSEYR